MYSQNFHFIIIIIFAVEVKYVYIGKNSSHTVTWFPFKGQLML